MRATANNGGEDDEAMTMTEYMRAHTDTHGRTPTGRTMQNAHHLPFGASALSALAHVGTTKRKACSLMWLELRRLKLKLPKISGS